MSVSTPTFQSQSTDAASTGVFNDQFVRVRVGELELAMNTECLSGIFQVSNQNRLTGNNTVLTSKGEYPVCDLKQLLEEKLGVVIGQTKPTALVAIESDGQMQMVLCDSVSRPIKTPFEHIHPMPRIGFKGGENLLDSVINLEPEAADPADSIRFSFDPQSLFGTVTNKKPSRANVLPKEAVMAMTASNFGGGNQASHRSRQLLAFIPEDIAASEVEHIFCLPLTAIAEVITVQPDLYTVGANENFDGFALWRKVPVPIVRLGNVFGFSSDDEQHLSRRLVIARATGNRFVGVYAKPQMQTMKVPESVAGNSESFKGRPHLGCFRTELGDLVVPDLNRILNNDF